ncbi:MAG TPA: PD-(D/E)XK nuclease family protein, partial [Methyloversatilis sp.]
MKPNLFSNAPNELAQDGFFVWLLQWADPSNRDHDENLHALAQDMVRTLMELPDDFVISKVAAGRQWQGIDLWAEINDEHFLLIEDKTDTSEHSDQLTRYRKIAEDHYLPKQFKLHFIYLKTGNESKRSLARVVEKGFRVFERQDILATFDRHRVANHICSDFNEHLRNIERESSSYAVHAQLLSNGYAAQGFCAALQKIKGGDADWGYVANPNGGFQGFWYFWNANSVFGEIYIQIENAFDRGIQVVIKVADWDEKID